MAGKCIGQGEPAPQAEGPPPEDLKLRQIIGFNGQVLRGLCVHPGGEHLVYCVGTNVVLEGLAGKGAGRQEFLSKHAGRITCLAVSPDGRFIASGESAQYDKACVVLWEFSTREALMHLPAHKGAVTDLVFLCGSHFFVSLGGPADRMVTVWSSILARPKLTQQAQPGRAETARCLAASRVEENKFITGGRATGRIWSISLDGGRLDYTDLKFAKHLHDVVCIEVADYDCLATQMAFCGTSSGDVMVFSVHTGNLQAVVPKKVLPHGVTCITYLRMLDDTTFSLLLGTGAGRIINYHVTLSMNKANRCEAVARVAPGTSPWGSVAEGKAITSISKVGTGLTFYVGSATNHIYKFSLHTFDAELIRTCSSTPIYALAFPRGTDDILVTGESARVRVFNLQLHTEARRYDRAGRTCYSLAVTHDGTQIVTGWDSGETIVLGFEPKCLKLRELYRVDCSQKQAVTSLALTSDSRLLVTGGGDGQGRVWRLTEDTDLSGRPVRQAILVHTLSMQQGPVTSLMMSGDDQRVLVASEDGTAHAYDVISGARVAAVRQGCGVPQATFCLQDLQALTAGNDGMLRQWELTDGSLIAEHTGCRQGALLTVATRGNKCPVLGNMAATGGDDTLVKVWSLRDGAVSHVGAGHSMAVHRLAWGPCGSVLVSAARDGSLCVWDASGM